MNDLSTHISACGIVEDEPLYTQLPSSLPVLCYWLRCENPSGTLAQLRVVSYGETAKEGRATVFCGLRLFLDGALQTRCEGDRRDIEVVGGAVMRLGTESLQPFGARAALVGNILNDPICSLLGETKTPFVRFMLRCANSLGGETEVCLVQFGALAATYAQRLRQGMRIVAHSEIRTHFYQRRDSEYGRSVLRFVADSIEIVA